MNTFPRTRALLPIASLVLVTAVTAQEPAEQPAQERGLVRHEEGAFEGYTLFTPLKSTTVYLIDMEGEVVHTWETEYRPGNSVYLQDDGRLFRACREDNPVFHGGGQGGRIQELSWEGEVLWDYVLSDEERMHHHDFEPLPNGNLLLIAWEMKSVEEAIAAGRDPERTSDEGFWPDVVIEIEPVRPSGAKVVWEWHAWDRRIQDFDPEKERFGNVTEHPERVDINADHRRTPPLTEAQIQKQREIERQMKALGYTGDDEDEEDDEGQDPQRERRRRKRADWLHTNGIDYRADLDLIVLSIHTLSEIWVIDHSTTTEEAAGSTGGRYGHGGDLLYRWGNPRTYGAQKGSGRKLFSQHDARWIPDGSPGAGNVMVFNNGSGRRGEGDYSSVDEIALPFDADGRFTRAREAAFAPDEPTWSYAAPEGEEFYSSFISGAHRLPNGNTLICSGAKGRIFEVTAEGQIVWEYLNPFGEEKREQRQDGGGPPGRGPGNMAPQGLFRATRIPLDHPAFEGRDL